MGSIKLIGQLHWSLFIVYYFCFGLLDSAHMRAQMQTSAQFKFALYIYNKCLASNFMKITKKKSENSECGRK